VAILFAISLCTTPKDVLIILKLNKQEIKWFKNILTIAQSKDGENGFVCFYFWYAQFAFHFSFVNLLVYENECLIFLCIVGGEEWKEVAERLGLTPREIRFLDNRTLNPFDAALAFIARQKNITVANLYDLLNECGYPVLADLL